jgi:hypothetical protein
MVGNPGTTIDRHGVEKKRNMHSETLTKQECQAG